MRPCKGSVLRRSPSTGLVDQVAGGWVWDLGITSDSKHGDGRAIEVDGEVDEGVADLDHRGRYHRRGVIASEAVEHYVPRLESGWQVLTRQRGRSALEHVALLGQRPDRIHVGGVIQ